MPAVAVAAIGAATASVATGIAVSAGIVAAGSIGAAVIGAVVGGVASQAVTKVLAPKPKLLGSTSAGAITGGSSTTSDRIDASPVLINETGSLAPVPIVYGETRIAPNRVYIGTSNNGNAAAGSEEYLHCCYTISNNLLYGIKDIYFDGVRVGGFENSLEVQSPLYPGYRTATYDPTINPPSGKISGFVIDSNYKNKVKTDHNIDLTTDNIDVVVYRGTPGQTFDAAINTNVNNIIVNQDFRGVGYAAKDRNESTVSYMWVRLRYNDKIFSGGVPLVQISVVGIADVRDVSWIDEFEVYTGSGVNNYTNAAVQIYEYLTFGYGKDLPSAWIDTDSFLETAKLLYDNGIRTNGVIDANQSVFDNLQELCANSLTTLVYSQGLYSLKYIAPNSTIFTPDTFVFNQDNILGEWTVNLGDKTKNYGKGRVNFYNKELDYMPDTVVIKKPGYVEPTGYRDNELEINLKFSDKKSDAIYIASALMAMSEYDITVSFKASIEALQLSPMDPVYITHPETGWVNKRFLVHSLTMCNDSTVDVILSEYADIYPITLAEEESTYDQIPPPALTAGYISAQSTSTDQISYTHTATLTVSPSDRLVIAAHGRGAVGADRRIVSIAFNGVLCTFDEEEITTDASGVLTTVVASVTNLTLPLATYNIVVTFANTAQVCVTSLYRISGGNALYPVSATDKKVFNQSNTVQTGFTLTFPEVPDNAVMIVATSSYAGATVPTTTISAPYTLTTFFNNGFDGNILRGTGSMTTPRVGMGTNVAITHSHASVTTTSNAIAVMYR